MTLNKYEKIAKKFFVEDLQPATLPSTTLSNILNTLELRDGVVSNRALDYLKQRELLALYAYVNQECSLVEYFSSAELEQKNRRLVVEQKAHKEQLRKAKLKEESAIRQQAALEKQRAYDNNPLREKYNLPCFIGNNCPQRLTRILKSIDEGQRLSENDIVWLKVDGEEYFTEELKYRFHANEANFYATEFGNKKDPWLAVNASSHYRKCEKSQTADLMLDTIKVSGLKNIKLKSAIYTTHGGVKRDLHKSKEAIALVAIQSIV